MEKLILRHKLRNFFQSLLLLSGMTLVLAFMGWLLAGEQGLVWIGIMGLTAFIMVPRLSPRFILRLYQARPLAYAEFPELHEVVRELSRRAALGYVPALYYVPSNMMNAFAVGSRNDAAIGVTDGMLRGMTLRELAGVLAHEISHIRHNDLAVMNLADWISRLTQMMASAGQFILFVTLPLWLFSAGGVPVLPWLLLIMAPWMSALLQLALSRTREFDADMGAVELTGDPEGLARALAKLGAAERGFWRRVLMPGWGRVEPSLLRTHPKTEERIERLKSLSLPASQRLKLPSGRFMSGSGRLQDPRWHWFGLWY